MIVTDTATELRRILTFDLHPDNLDKDTLEYKVAYGGLMDGFWLDGLNSWRGSYSVIAGTYTYEKGYSHSVSDLLEGLIEYYKGEQLEGYKGGTYTAEMYYPLYVANYGETMPNHLYSTGMDGYAGVVGLELDHDNKIVKLIVEDVAF